MGEIPFKVGAMIQTRNASEHFVSTLPIMSGTIRRTDGKIFGEHNSLQKRASVNFHIVHQMVSLKAFFESLWFWYLTFHWDIKGGV